MQIPLRWFRIQSACSPNPTCIRHDDIYGTCSIFLHLKNLDWWTWSLKKKWPELMFRVGNPWVFWRRCLLPVSTVHWLWNWRWHLSLVSRLAFGCANVNGCQAFSMFLCSCQVCRNVFPMASWLLVATHANPMMCWFMRIFGKGSWFVLP